MINIYLCGSIANAQVNALIAGLLKRFDFDVFDPCEIVPEAQPKAQFSQHVYSICKEAIERCDILLVFLDSYGRDSAWEVGFARGLGKRIVGLAVASNLFLEDWMVKYAIDNILVLNPGWIVPGSGHLGWRDLMPQTTVISLDSLANNLKDGLTLNSRCHETGRKQQPNV